MDDATGTILSAVLVGEEGTASSFAVPAAEEGTAFVPFVGALDDVLCVQEERIVGRDNTVR